MTTFTVPSTARPIAEDMFADLGIPLVAFTATADGGVSVDAPVTLKAAQILRGRIRLLTASDGQEAMLVAAMVARDTDIAYQVGTHTTAQAVAQVKVLTAQVQALLEWVAKDALG